MIMQNMHFSWGCEPVARASVVALRQQEFFDRAGIQDPYLWTMGHPEHRHAVLSVGGEVTGYGHIQLWPRHRAALRIMVVVPERRQQGWGRLVLTMCEQALVQGGIRSFHAESRPDSVLFYRQNGWTDMPFGDPEGHPSCPDDIPLGKQF